MREYVTEAIVLKKEPVREFDARVSLFTKEAGKVTALVTSARKTLSKLSAHLEPLSVAEVRLAEKGGIQLTDALKKHALPLTQFPLLAILDAMVATGERDDAVWSLMHNPRTGMEELLALLGFDPRFALCESCGAESPSIFVFTDARYICRRCLPIHMRRGEFAHLAR